MASSRNNDNSKVIFAAQSHVRNACDACYKRKIRCVMSRSGGSCHNCKSRSLSCYFLPRYKSGRPRIRGPPSHNTINSATVTPPGSIMNTSLWPGTENTVPSAPARKSPPRADHQRNNDDLFVWDSHQDFAIQTEQHSYDLDQPLKFPSVLRGASLDLEEPTFPNFTNPTHRPLTNIQFEDLPDPTSPAPLDTQTSVWSTTSQQPSDRSGPRIETSKEARFATLLEYCARLQRYIMTMEEYDSTISDEGTSSTSKKIGMSDGPLREVLEDIDTSCKLMSEMCDEGTSSKSISAQVNSPPDSASICLITTVTFKVFQICNILFNGKGLRICSIKDVLLQKRLDFNITQARIVTAQIENLTQNNIHILQELLGKAVHIEERFTNQRGGNFTDKGKLCS
ncbi:hypothetical protein N7537_001588 [Penicillium hordei]|uniref:Zn(2)-C6 fungal-type domain-containing protein n=1 Tax=Penicillium hordei TaxID=40994 RepID=A0AAD6EFR1_9EURO|nr:uncharacterized protein N7537_001588 [Penicillium hordei]KAJ5616474.1 hypothetical protein N7537_001588 [Penicillium hordei]